MNSLHEISDSSLTDATENALGGDSYDSGTDSNFEETDVVHEPFEGGAKGDDIEGVISSIGSTVLDALGGVGEKAVELKEDILEGIKTAADNLTPEVSATSPSSDPEKSDVDEKLDLESVHTKSGEDTEDTDESEDEDAFKKLEHDINSSILLEYHPEMVQNSYSEILTLSKVVRNDKGIIIDELHKTYPFVTKYEYARIVGIRTKQLNNGADPFVDVEPEVIDGFTIAMKEFEQKKLPYIVARPLPNGSREYWKLKDLEIIHF